MRIALAPYNLPDAAADVSTSRRVRRGRCNMGRGNILIADDDAAIRTVVNQALARAGYSARATSNAATLWNWVAQGEGDVVITDVIMPDENAFDLIPRIKKIRPELPIIVMSAQNTFMTAITAAERGAYEYLPKPFDLKELVAVVGRALREPKLAKSAMSADGDEREPAADRALRVHAGCLPRHGEADAHRSHGADHRRIRHRQGAGGARAARLRPAAERSVHRHQHGRDPARADRVRAVRPREGRVHGSRRALHRALRAGRWRHAVPGRDRRHADGGANPAPARAAGRRVHDGWRPRADQDRRAHRRRHQQEPGAPDIARACSARISITA